MSILHKIKLWWYTPKHTGRTWKMWEHQDWGNRISWWDVSKRKIDGHMSSTIDGYLMGVGDDLLVNLRDGRIGRCRIIQIEFMRDPRDQFFGTVTDIGYEP